MGSERRLPETSDVMVCLMNSHDDSTCGEVRLTLHLMPFCRACGITETWAALAWLNYNNASDVKPHNVPHAVELRKRKSVTRSTSKQPVKKSQMLQSTLLSPSDDTLCAVALSTSI